MYVHFDAAAMAICHRKFGLVSNFYFAQRHRYFLTLKFTITARLNQ